MTAVNGPYFHSGLLYCIELCCVVSATMREFGISTLRIPSACGGGVDSPRKLVAHQPLSLLKLWHLDESLKLP